MGYSRRATSDLFPQYDIWNSSDTYILKPGLLSIVGECFTLAYLLLFVLNSLPDVAMSRLNMWTSRIPTPIDIRTPKGVLRVKHMKFEDFIDCPFELRCIVQGGRLKGFCKVWTCFSKFIFMMMYVRLLTSLTIREKNTLYPAFLLADLNDWPRHLIFILVTRSTNWAKKDHKSFSSAIQS